MIHVLRIPNRFIASAALPSLVLPMVLAAQSVVTGVIRVDSSGQPVAGAEVIIERLGRRAVSDLSGRYTLPDMPTGDHVALVRFVGYRPFRLYIRTGDSDTTWANFLLTPSAQPLEPVTVTAPPSEYHLRKFEENRKMGFGEFLDSTYLRRWESVNLSDLLARVPGVTILCDRVPPVYYKPCYAAVKHASRGTPCLMRVFVDGQPSPLTDMRTGWKAADLDGVEIYRSAAGIPAEYNSASSACGVVALWTRKP